MKRKLIPNGKQWYNWKRHPLAFKMGYGKDELDYKNGHVTAWRYYYLLFWTLEVHRHYFYHRN